MVEDWVKTKVCPVWLNNDLVMITRLLQTPIVMNQSPSLREKAILLVRLMQHVEKRFPDDSDLNAQFLELVNYIYR